MIGLALKLFEVAVRAVRGAGGVVPGPGAGVDNLILEDGSNLILTTGGTEVLLLA